MEKLWMALVSGALLAGCAAPLNPTGHRTSAAPSYFTEAPVRLNNLALPPNTMIVYDRTLLGIRVREGRQSKPLNPKYITGFNFAETQPVRWGGMPLAAVDKFANSEMSGYSLRFAPEAKQLDNPLTRVLAGLENCGLDDSLDILVKDNRN